MKPEEQIKALAELDGVRWCCANCNGYVDDCRCSSPRWKDEPPNVSGCTDYLTSYDAIIPLIQRQEVGARAMVMHQHPSGVTFMSTPAQLCEALLRAIGKWKE